MQAEENLNLLGMLAHMLVIRRLRQKDYKFEDKQDYIVRPCLKKPRASVIAQR